VFGDALVEAIEREATALAQHRGRGMSLAFDLAGVRVGIFQLSGQHGSRIDYARFMPEMTDFPERVKNCLDTKAPKLRRYNDARMETYIVIFNTMGVAISPIEAKRITKAQCGPAHDHVTHISLVADMPPDDAWVQVISPHFHFGR